MSQEVSMQPRLYAEDSARSVTDEDTLARIARLKKLQDRIENNPVAYQAAFDELGASATDSTLDLHDESTSVRSASRTPKVHIQEYFAKRDDTEMLLDDESDEVIFSDRDVINAITAAKSKTAIMKRTGVMGTTREPHHEADTARDESRRIIFGKYLGRVVTWHEQETGKTEQQAG